MVDAPSREQPQMTKKIILNAAGKVELTVWHSGSNVFIQQPGAGQSSMDVLLLPELIKQLQKIQKETMPLPPRKNDWKELEKTFMDTQARLLQWGLQEIRLRRQDLSNRTEGGLKIAKLAAKSRREAAGLTEAEAVLWMKAARKELADSLVKEDEAQATISRDVPATDEVTW